MTYRGVSYEGSPPPRKPSGGERRVALVIGNGGYTHAEPLANPVRDAEAMAARLDKLGFDVVKGLDLDLRKLGDVQSTFEDKLRGKPDVALLFYAGHGLQVEGRNYLVPVDAEITTKSHLATRALLFNDLLDDMARDAGASLIFLDACRDNPFTRNLARSMGDSARYAGVRGGLARIEKVAGTFIAYATAPDQVAFDGKGQNSPFTSALLAHIETPGLSVGDLMIDVRNNVLAETNNRQEPWDQSSLRARFYFVPPEVTPPPLPQTVSEAEREWSTIQGTTSLAVLAAFQERHPDPPWSNYAEASANELRAADAARQDAERRRRAENQASKQNARTQERARNEAHPDKIQNAGRKNSSASPVLALAGAAAVAVLAFLAISRPWESKFPADSQSLRTTKEDNVPAADMPPLTSSVPTSAPTDPRNSVPTGVTAHRDPTSPSLQGTAVTGPQAKPVEPSAQVSPEASRVPPDTIDRNLQKSPLWQVVKKELPDWYEERVAEISRLSNTASEIDLSRHLLGKLVERRRQDSKFALMADDEHLVNIASAFLRTLKSLAEHSVEACYNFISRGETSPTAIALFPKPGYGDAIEGQLAAVFRAIANGRESPVERSTATKVDYDILAKELSKIGWSPADLGLFSNPEALAKAPQEQVCKMVQDWFSAILAIGNQSVKVRLLPETLRPVVAG